MVTCIFIETMDNLVVDDHVRLPWLILRPCTGCDESVPSTTRDPLILGPLAATPHRSQCQLTSLAK
jgi:hypothetical protein